MSGSTESNSHSPGSSGLDRGIVFSSAASAAPGARQPDWRSAFAAAIEAHRAPFAWGRHDCGLLAADAILAVAGVDVAAPFRGRYSSAAEAIALLDREGRLDAEAVIAARFRRIEPIEAVEGDLAVIPAPTVVRARWIGLALAPVLGAELAAWSRYGGVLGAVPRTLAIRAYRIERIEGLA